jgi:hypothetical protein
MRPPIHGAYANLLVEVMNKDFSRKPYFLVSKQLKETNNETN